MELETDKNFGQSLFTEVVILFKLNTCDSGPCLTILAHAKDEEEGVRITCVNSGKVSFTHPVPFRNVIHPLEAKKKD